MKKLFLAVVITGILATGAFAWGGHHGGGHHGGYHRGGGNQGRNDNWCNNGCCYMGQYMHMRGGAGQQAFIDSGKLPDGTQIPSSILAKIKEIHSVHAELRAAMLANPVDKAKAKGLFKKKMELHNAIGTWFFEHHLASIR